MKFLLKLVNEKRREAVIIRGEERVIREEKRLYENRSGCKRREEKRL